MTDFTRDSDPLYHFPSGVSFLKTRVCTSIAESGREPVDNDAIIRIVIFAVLLNVPFYRSLLTMVFLSLVEMRTRN